MHSLVRSAAQHIERELLVDHSQCQQALFDTYLRTDARSRAAVMAVGDSLVMTNAKAQQLLDAVDQAVLQEHARFLMRRHDVTDDRIELPSGTSVRIRGSRIMVGNDIAGMVLVITDVSAVPGEGRIGAGRIHRGNPSSRGPARHPNAAWRLAAHGRTKRPR